MEFSSWLRNLKRSDPSERHCTHGSARKRTTYRPRLEAFEERCLPSAQAFLALGDSITFGETNVIPTSYGDQGFVKPFADYLATQNGGVRPHLVNLAIPGESTTTFFDPTAPNIASHQAAAAFNLNYTNLTASQESLFRARVAAEQQAGRAVTYVSFKLGENDFNTLLAVTHPEDFTLPPAQQQLLIGQTLGAIQANYTRALTEIRQALPQANLLLPDSYGTDDPSASGQAINAVTLAYRQIVRAEAGAFHGTLVDLYQPFAGHVADYTFSATGNGHPNDLGYQVIAQQLKQATPTTTVQASVNPSVFGQAVTFTASVNPLAPSVVAPTGVVLFLDGSTRLGTASLNGSGQAQWTITTPLSVGTHSITAAYTGDTHFTGSASLPLEQRVKPARTTTALAVSVAPPGAHVVSLSATVTPIAPGAGVPSGTVFFLDLTTRRVLGFVNLRGAENGVAVLPIAYSGAGRHTILAVFVSDNGNFSDSISNPFGARVFKGQEGGSGRQGERRLLGYRVQPA